MTASIDPESISVIHLRLGGANAINQALFTYLSAEMAAAVRAGAPAIVLTGHGRFFSAGLDLISLYEFTRDQMEVEMKAFSEGLLQLATFPKPIVAAINGHAIAGGCILGMACDYRIAAEGEYKIGLNEIQLGIPFPVVALELAKAAIPVDRHAETMFFGELFSPAEALKRSLIDELAPAEELLPLARSRAAKLGGWPASGYRQIKLDSRHSLVDRVRSRLSEQTSEFLDIWFDADTRARLGEMRASLLAKKKS